MFRRNRPALQNNVLSAAQIEVLAKANQLAANNNSADAAPLYAELARELDVPRPRRAANLHARAAHAYADAGNEQLALAQARAALTMFIQYRMINRTPVFFANITRKFNNKGMKNSATARCRTNLGTESGRCRLNPPKGRRSDAFCRRIVQSAARPFMAMRPPGLII